MKEFFHGARTKMGLLTLVTACFFLVGWFRSQTRFEYIDVSIGNVSYGVTSMHSGLDFSRTTANAKSLQKLQNLRPALQIVR